MHSIKRLLKMMEELRDTDSGCPWDKQQDFASIAPYTIEEAYEVAEVIEKKAYGELCNELGDLLFQVIYHAQMAKEAGLFEFSDVVTAISDKIEKRHPHVFSDKVIHSAKEQNLAWENQKIDEQDENNPASILDNISQAMPALMRAQKLQKRAAAVGFDWVNRKDVLNKLHEELNELMEEVLANDPEEQTSIAENNTAIREELGDVLFSTVNLARHLQVDAEAALRSTNLKFTQRFRYMEDQLKASGKNLKNTDIEQMEALWQEAKYNINQ